MRATSGIVERLDHVSESWEPGEIDIQGAMTDLTTRIALSSLLGTDEQTDGLVTEVRREFEEILDWITFRFNRPASLPAVVPTGRNRKLKVAKAKLRQAITRLIEHRRDHDDGSMDVLSQLVRAQRDTTHDLTDDAILHECIGFMFAGHETTASTLTWALDELARRPELQEAIADEGSMLRVDSRTLTEDLQAMNTRGPSLRRRCGCIRPASRSSDQRSEQPRSEARRSGAARSS